MINHSTHSTASLVVYSGSVTTEAEYQFFQGPFFKIAYPGHWEMEIIEQIPAFFDPDGAGAVQVVATSNSSGDNFEIDQEILKCLKNLEINSNEVKLYQSVDRHGNECRSCEFLKEERFWLLHMVCHQNFLLLIMYNADEIPDQKLAQTISIIAQSAVFEPENEQ